MKILIYLVLIILIFVAYVRFLEATTVFVPTRTILATPKDAGLSYEDIHFKTIDHKTLHGWLIKADPNEKITGTRSTLIFLHGNAGNIGDRVHKIFEFQKLGLNVFIFDYRGFGLSQGRPTEQGMYYDAMAALDYLKARDDINPDKFVLYGASLGGVAAVELAVHRRVSCLILDSTFTSAADMGKTIVPFVPSFMLKIKLDSINKIQKVSAPKLFLHSPDDEVVPFELGKKLFDAAPGPKEFVEIQGSHIEGYSDSQDMFFDSIYTFLKKYNLIIEESL